MCWRPAPGRVSDGGVWSRIGTWSCQVARNPQRARHSHVTHPPPPFFLERHPRLSGAYAGPTGGVTGAAGERHSRVCLFLLFCLFVCVCVCVCMTAPGLTGTARGVGCGATRTFVLRFCLLRAAAGEAVSRHGVQRVVNGWARAVAAAGWRILATT
jgi:hypothetical protein